MNATNLETTGGLKESDLNEKGFVDLTHDTEARLARMNYTATDMLQRLDCSYSVSFNAIRPDGSKVAFWFHIDNHGDGQAEIFATQKL